MARVAVGQVLDPAVPSGGMVALPVIRVMLAVVGAPMSIVGGVSGQQARGGAARRDHGDQEAHCAR